MQVPLTKPHSEHITKTCIHGCMENPLLLAPMHVLIQHALADCSAVRPLMAALPHLSHLLETRHWCTEQGRHRCESPQHFAYHSQAAVLAAKGKCLRQNRAQEACGACVRNSLHARAQIFFWAACIRAQLAPGPNIEKHDPRPLGGPSRSACGQQQQRPKNGEELHRQAARSTA